MHVDSSAYGWGAVLNDEATEAHGFMYDGDRELHIFYKELKALRYYVVPTFLSEMLGRQLAQPPWGLIGDLVIKLHASGQAATVIVPYWPDRSWHQRLSDEMASEMVMFPPSPDLFAPNRLGMHDGVGRPK
eukprot:jgi/Tetstr1/444659/TSEL_032507.t1